MNTGIADYQVEYFLPTVREVLDPLLAKQGFNYAGNHRGVTAYWVCGSRFFRAGYLAESLPCYELLLGVGEFEGSPLEPKSSSNSVGLWRLLPPEVAPDIADWRFDGPEALSEELRRAWQEAFAPFVMPIWGDGRRLRRLIAEHNDEITGEDEKLMQDRLLRYARQEFEAGRFLESKHAYDQLGEEALTSADRKRAEIARRHL